MIILKIKRELILISLIFYLTSNNWANQVNPIYRSSYVECLENGYNSFIQGDSKGFIWISSLKGAYLFNGIDCRYFPLNSFDDGNVQSSFFEDKKSNIWVTTYKAIHYYNRNSGEFKSFQLHKNLKKNIGYHLFHLDYKKDILWLKVNNHIYTYQPEKNYLEEITATKGVRFTIDKDEKGSIRQIISCPWISDSGFEVIKIAEDCLISREKFWDKDVFKKGIEVNSAYIQKNNHIIFSSNLGVGHWDSKNPTKVKITPSPENGFSSVQKGYLINKNQMLFPFKNKGIWSYNLLEQKFNTQLIYGKEDEDNRNPIIHNIYIDKYNHLWISEENNRQVKFLNLKENVFNNPFTNLPLEKSKVSSITVDGIGRIWCLSERGGISVFQNNKKLVAFFPNDDNRVSKLSTDTEGNIWGIGGQHISIYDLKKGRWEFIYKGLPRKGFFLIHLSPTRKLISTSGNRLYDLIFQDDKWAIQNSKNSFPIKNSSIYHLLEGKLDYCYLPFNNNSIKLINKKREAFEIDIITNYRVYGVKEDELRQRTWLATANGLAYFNWEEKEKVIYIDNKKLKSKFITTVNLDKKNQLWLTTNKELLKYQPEQKQAYIFRQEEGFMNSSFSKYANTVASDGKMWIGTNNGLLVFHPDSIQPYAYKPKVHVQSFKVNNKPYDLGKNINELLSISLPYYQNNIDLKLVAVSYHLTKYNELQYRLKGYNDDWELIKNGEWAHFNQIPSGEYKLEIFGVNGNGIKGASREITFTIELPWWRTKWALALELLSLLIITYLIAKIYNHFKRKEWEAKREEERRIERKKREIQEMRHEERNRIGAELHDNMGTGLALIKVNTEEGLKKITSEQAKDKLGRVIQIVGELHEEIQDIIWASNPENEILESLIAKMQSEAYEYLEANDLECTFKIADNIPEIKISGIIRKNVIAVLRESLRNTHRYAEATKIDIQIQFNVNDMSIAIKDDGIGFDPTKKPKGGGNGIRNIKNRINKIKGTVIFESSQGTTISIIIPYYLDKN